MNTLVVPGHRPSDWLEHRVGIALSALTADRVCGHHGDYGVLALWDELLRCPMCHLAAMQALPGCDPAEDQTCDRCRRQIEDDVLYPVVLGCFGGLYVAFGLCIQCLDLEGVDLDAVG